MTDRLKSVRDMLTPSERRRSSPLYAFGASVALAVSALALAGMMIMGPDRDRPRVVTSEEVPLSQAQPEDAGTFEISRTPEGL